MDVTKNKQIGFAVLISAVVVAIIFATQVIAERSVSYQSKPEGQWECIEKERNGTQLAYNISCNSFGWKIRGWRDDCAVYTEEGAFFENINNCNVTGEHNFTVRNTEPNRVSDMLSSYFYDCEVDVYLKPTKECVKWRKIKKK